MKVDIFSIVFFFPVRYILKVVRLVCHYWSVMCLP